MQDLKVLATGFNITIREAVEDIEEYFDCDVISYISIPSPVGFSMLESNDCIALDNLLSNIKEPRNSGNKDGKKFQKIVLILHSGGGVLEAAIKFVDIIRFYAEEFEVIVPMMAKSAATLISLKADKLYYTSLTELGPVDPIVQNPTNPSMFVPATAIDNFLKYYKENLDQSPKGSPLDQLFAKKIENTLDPYILGSYKGALEFSKDEIKKALEKNSMQDGSDEDRKEALEELTTNHSSHGYPLTYKFLKKYNIGELIKDESKLKAVKLLISIYQQFMVNGNIVKLIGNRNENINTVMAQNSQTNIEQIATKTSL